MGVKEIIKETFGNEEKITITRYKAAKTNLIFINFLFFLNFYFVGAGFYPKIFNFSLSIIYLLLLLSLLFYFYFLIKKMIINNTKIYFNIIIFIILFLIFGFLSLPAIFNGGFEGVMKLVNLYY